MPKTRPLSKTLANGHLAALSRLYMERFFRRKLPLWYPGWNLVKLVVKDKSRFEFKKAVRYTLLLESADGRQRQQRVFRGNIPSLDTTRETRIAHQTMRAVWKSVRLRQQLPIARPLTFDTTLRLLLYEDAPGVPLLQLIRANDPKTEQWVEQSAVWLARLHQARLRVGRERGMLRERREAGFFLFNYHWCGQHCSEKAKACLQQFLDARTALDPAIKKGGVLVHGDFNPSNIIVDQKKKIQRVIDFGNAWRYDPMYDLANAVVQFSVLRWHYQVPQRRASRLAEHFLHSYRKTKTINASESKRFYLFTAWWYLQTLSYTLAIYHKASGFRPMIHDVLRGAEQALQQIGPLPRPAKNFRFRL